MHIKTFVIVTLLTFCSIARAENNSASIRKFTVGVIIPLTGDLAEYGSAIRNGFEMRKQERPADFSNIDFIYEDSRYDGKIAVEALQKLKSSNSVDLYYLWGVSPTEAMLPIAASQKLPVIAETTVKEATVGKPLVVRAARTGERIAHALSAELVKRNVKSLSFIVTEIPFYLDILKHLEVDLQKNGISVLRKQEVLPTQADFKSFLLDRSSRENENLGVFLLPSQLITFYRQLDQAQLSIPTFNADILDSETIVKNCPPTINGTFFTQVGTTQDFRKKYQLTFSDDIQLGSAAQSYDVASIISELFGKLDRKLTAEEVIKMISEIPPHTGATGSFSYSETADAGKEIRMPVSMKIIRDKSIETLTEDTGF